MRRLATLIKGCLSQNEELPHYPVNSIFGHLLRSIYNLSWKLPKDVRAIDFLFLMRPSLVSSLRTLPHRPAVMHVRYRYLIGSILRLT